MADQTIDDLREWLKNEVEFQKSQVEHFEAEGEGYEPYVITAKARVQFCEQILGRFAPLIYGIENVNE